MVADNLKSIVNNLTQQGDMYFCEGTEESQITAFEELHDIKLPDKYREWLRFSDGGELFLPAGVQLYGVDHKPVINVNDDDRPDDNYIVIGALASGDPVIFRKTEQIISIYNHDAGRIEDDESYDDFFCFLNDLYDALGIGD